MNCQEVSLLWYKYLDQQLSSNEEEAFFAHIDLCAGCTRELAEAVETDRLLKQVLVPVLPPPDFTARIMARIPEASDEAFARATRQPRNWWEVMIEGWKSFAGSWQFKTIAVSLGVLVFVLFGNSFYRPNQSDDPDIPEIIVSDAGQNDSKIEPIEPEVVPDQENLPETTPKDPVEEPGEKQEKITADDPPTPADQGKPQESIITNVVEMPQPANTEINTKTMEIQALVQDLPGDASHPVLTAAGTAIHFMVTSDEVVEEWELFLQEGAAPQKVTPDHQIIDREQSAESLPEAVSEIEAVKGAEAYVLSWSADRKQLVLNVASDNKSLKGLWTVQADGSNANYLTSTGGGNEVAWSPDNFKIAFNDENNNIYIFYSRENLLLQITNAEESFYQIDHLVWGSDSQSIIFDGKRNSGSRSEIFAVQLP